MVKKTFVFGFSSDGVFTDKFVYNHPINKKTKEALGAFLARHFRQHPNGYVKAISIRTKNEVKTEPDKVKKNLF